MKEQKHKHTLSTGWQSPVAKSSYQLSACPLLACRHFVRGCVPDESQGGWI